MSLIEPLTSLNNPLSIGSPLTRHSPPWTRYYKNPYPCSTSLISPSFIRLRDSNLGVLYSDPLTTTIVFVFLPSKTRNSVGIWRRKLPMPHNMQAEYGEEVGQLKAELAKRSYIVNVDHIPEGHFQHPDYQVCTPLFLDPLQFRMIVNSY